ncbi:MAG: carbohydrate-binding family 9-like protein [Planctomycetota bacterium]
MAEYTIRKVDDFTVDADPDKDTWQGVPSLPIDVYRWYKSGKKQDTEVKVVYSDTAVYCLFACQDKHISAERRELNGPVCRDSCVEFFATVEPDKQPHYFNLEMNCCGQLHLGWGPERGEDRKLVSPELARKIEIASTVPGQTKTDSPEDDGWVLEVKLPFEVLRQHCGYTFTGSGTVWKANFYRCGGTDDQYASTFPIELPKPDFHRPEFFQPIVFE